MTDSPATRQLILERSAVDAMYQRLDQELSDARDAHRRALTMSIESPQDLFPRDAEVSRLTRTISERRAAESRLCFGRIDTFTGESMHVGRIGLRDEVGELLLIDWRADAARPFNAATPLSSLPLHHGCLVASRGWWAEAMRW